MTAIYQRGASHLVTVQDGGVERSEHRELRVGVQDRQRLFRDVLAIALTAEPDVEVVAAVATGAELVAAVADADLDVVLLELDTADWDACRLVVALRQRNSRLTVVGTLAGDGDRPPMRAYQAGVRIVFPRSAGICTLLQAIHSVPAHAPAPAPRKVVRLAPRRPLLTSREVEVLGAIGSGATARSLAAVMGISPKAVENHKGRIFEKLGVQNQAHAMSVALRLGLLTPTAALAGMGA
jgi:DNA-binding NarL/FixJ family response regulator